MEGRSTPFIVRQSSLDQKAMRFEMADAITKEPAGKFLRHAGYVCWVHDENLDDALLQKDSTFFPEVSDKEGCVKLRSINFPKMALGYDDNKRVRLGEWSAGVWAWKVVSSAEPTSAKKERAPLFGKVESEVVVDPPVSLPAPPADKGEGKPDAEEVESVVDEMVEETVSKERAPLFAKVEEDEAAVGEIEPASLPFPPAAAGSDRRDSVGSEASHEIDNHPESDLVFSGENDSSGGEEHDHHGIWADKKEKVEVWCEGMEVGDEEVPVNRFSMTLPEGITSGTVLEDIDGRGHDAVVPDGYEAGDEIILVMPAPERSGDLPLPNRNCFFAYAPPFMGGVHSKRYYEGDVQEASTGKIHFYRDSDNSCTKNTDVTNLVPLRRGKLRVRDQVLAYRSTEEEGMSEGDVVRIHVDDEKRAQIFVDFSHTHKTRKQREVLYNSTVKDLYGMHHSDDVDIIAVPPEHVFKMAPFNHKHSHELGEEGGHDPSVDDMFAPDTGLLPYHARGAGRLMCATMGCSERSEEEPEKHLSAKKAIMNRDSQSVRYLNPDTDQYEYYKFFSTVVPFYWFPGIDLFCPASQREETSFLDKYGFGVLAYFKLLKSMIVVFLLMTIITVPSVLIYSLADITSASSAYYLAQTDYMSTLAYSTVAALTEPKLMCQEGIESETMRLQCPEYYTMTGVIAYYGQPTGNCACPTYNQPSTDLGDVGSCRSTYNEDTVSCEAAADGTTYGCIKSTDRFDNVCCAYSYSTQYNEVRGRWETTPDLTGLDLAADYDCNSATAQYIATALCEGQNNCEIFVEGDTDISFRAADLINTEAITGTSASAACDSSTMTVDAKGDNICHTTLNTGGAFSGCSSGIYPYYNFSTGSNSTADRRLVMEAYCTVAEIDVSGLVYTPRELTFMTAVLGAAAIFVYIVALALIKDQQSKAVDAMEAHNVQASDYTIMLHTLPEGAKDRRVKSDPEQIKADIKAFFEEKLFDEKDGAPISVADVNLATICDDYLGACVTRGKACETVDKTLAKIQSSMRRKVWDEEGAGKKLMRELKRALLQFEYSNDTCMRLSEIASTSPYCAYVTFEHEDSYAKCIAKYPNVGVFTPLSQAREDKLGGKAVYIEPAPLPEEIIWENLPTPWWNRLIRVIITTVIVILLLVVSYAMIYQARFTGEQYSSSQVEIDCALYTVNTNQAVTNYTTNTISHFDVLMDTYPAYYNLDTAESDWGQRGYARCFCEGVLYQSFTDGDADPVATMTAYKFQNPDTSEDAYLCASTESNLSLFFASFATFVVVFVNGGLAVVLRKMVKFERHQTKTGELLSSCFKLFIAQYINTAWLTQLISGDLDLAGGSDAEISFSFPGYPDLRFGTFTGTIDDYNTKWYFSVGASLMFTMFIFSAGQLPPQYLVVAYQKCARLWDRRWNFARGYTHKDTQEELDALYLGPTFPIEQKYAYLLTLIFVDLTYSATMPLMNFVTLVNLVVFFVSDKITLLFFYQKPPVINPALPQLVVNALFGAAVVHLANGIWMFGNEGFTGPDITTSYATMTSGGTEFLSTSTDYDETVSYYDRALAYNSLPYLCVLLLTGALFAFKSLDTFIFDVLGLRTILFAISNSLEKSCPAYNCIGSYKKELEGLPSYFEAIPLLTLKRRVAEHTLEEDIEHTYCEYIAKEEEDRAGLGESFSVDKAATMRYRRSSIGFEHKRRESLLRLSLSDENQSVSLDDVDRFHDVNSLVKHNKEEYENYMMGKGKGRRSSWMAMGSSKDEEEQDADNSGMKRGHHDTKSLPNRNCPVVYFPEHDNADGMYYEGTYLQYQEPDLVQDIVHTRFTFLKHFSDAAQQVEAVPIENVPPAQLFLLYKGKRGEVKAGDDVICYTGHEDVGMTGGKCAEIKADGTLLVTLTETDTDVTVPRAWCYLRAPLKDNRVGKFNEDDDVDFVGEGQVFTGQLIRGLPEGYGKLVYNDNDDDEEKKLYEGEFKAGVWHGQGRLEFVNGDVYDGDFVEGIYNGLGTLTSSDGQIYNGSFLNGDKDGRGRYVSADGAIHIGTWKDGELDSASALEFPPGQQPDQVECGECGPRYTAVGESTARNCCGQPKCDFSKRHHIHIPGCPSWCCNLTEKRTDMAEEIRREKGLEGDEEEAEKNKALDDEAADELTAQFLQGHESYNMDTIPEYKSKFGLSQIHMARRDPKDYIMESTNLPHIHDANSIKTLLRRAEPYKLNVPVLDENGEPTGEVKKVIPAHSLWVQAVCQLFGGSSASLNRSVGCECLAEPDDEGEQPKYICPCC